MNAKEVVKDMKVTIKFFQEDLWPQRHYFFNVDSNGHQTNRSAPRLVFEAVKELVTQLTGILICSIKGHNIVEEEYMHGYVSCRCTRCGADWSDTWF